MVKTTWDGTSRPIAVSDTNAPITKSVSSGFAIAARTGRAGQPSAASAP